jgi:hypothetical protein
VGFLDGGITLVSATIAFNGEKQPGGVLSFNDAMLTGTHITAVANADGSINPNCG